MSFTQNTFAPIGANAAPCPALYSYSSDDDLSTVTTANYFLPKQPQLDEGDWILAYLSDGHAILEVLTDTSSVKTIDLAVSVDQRIVEASTNYIASLDDDVIFATGNITVTYPDSSLAVKSLTVKNISGTTTLASAGGTIESTSLTTSQSVTQAPIPTGWFIV